MVTFSRDRWGNLWYRLRNHVLLRKGRKRQHTEIKGNILKYEDGTDLTI